MPITHSRRRFAAGWALVGRRMRPRALCVVGVLMAAPLAALAPAAASTTLSSSPLATARVDGTVRSVVESGGLVYIGGTFSSATDSSGTVTRNNAAAFDAGTGQLTAWNPDTNGEVDSLAVSGSTVYLGGNFTAVGGRSRMRLAAVDSNTGAVSSAFVHSAGAAVRSLSLSSDGSQLYAGGGFATVDGSPRAYLAAFTLSSGVLNGSWKPAASGPVRTVSAQPGRVYVGGNFITLNGSTAHGYLAAVSPSTGATDDTFKANIKYLVNALSITSTAVYAAADGPGGHLRAFTLGGANLWNVTADGAFNAVTVLNGDIFAGGHFDNICTTARTGINGSCLDGQAVRHKLASVSTAGTLTGWAPQANSAAGVFAMDSNPAKYNVAVGGAFTTFDSGSVTQPHIAVFD
jgi:hypothetical protein